MIGRFVAIVVLSGCLLSGCASVVVDPSWARLPDPHSQAENFPLFASMVGLEANVQLRCVAQADGRLANCRVTKATPAGLGFEEAALSQTGEYLLNPRQVDGQPAKGSVAFTVRFRLAAEDEPPPPWTGPDPTPERLEAARAALSVAETMFPDTPSAWMPLGVAPDRDEKVREMIQLNAAAFRERNRAAMVIMMARSWTPEQLAFATSREGPVPPAPTWDTMFEALYELSRLETEAMEALRERYCRSYACPAVDPAPEPRSESPVPSTP